MTSEGLSLDMAQPDAKRAVEVDGPTHFVKNVVSTEQVENGRTRFKSRLLCRLGWDIVHVPFFEWDALKGSSKKDAYLKAKLGSWVQEST